MTLLKQPEAGATARTAAHHQARIEHPVFGAARKATVVAESLIRYRISIGGTVLGYLDATAGAWTARSGDRAETARPVGQHRYFAGALRLLTNP